MKKIVPSKKRGSVAVYAILLMAVTLAIALPAIKKSTQNLQLSEDQQIQTKTLNYAEQVATNILGEIHQLYLQGLPISISPGEELKPDGTIVKYSVDILDEIITNLDQGTTIELNLTGAGNIDFLWWDQGIDCTVDNPASLMASVYTDTGGGNIIAKHYAFGPCSSTRKPPYDDRFEPPNALPVLGYQYHHVLAVTNNDIMIRFKPVYSDTAIKVTGSPISSAQAQITVRAQAPTEKKDTQVVKIDRFVDSGPAILDYSLVSGSTISQ